MVQTTDRDLVLVVYTESSGAGGQDAWLFRTDEAGKMLWNRTYGDVNNDTAYTVQQTSDGGFIIAGRTQSFGTEAIDRAWVFKTDKLGLIFQDSSYFLL